MLLRLDVSVDADPKKLASCRTVVSSFSWISGYHPDQVTSPAPSKAALRSPVVKSHVLNLQPIVLFCFVS